MKIVYLHQYFMTPEMAGGTRSFEMARRLAAAGHEVHMITSDQHGGNAAWRESDEQGIHVHWASVPYSNEMGFVRRIVAFVQFALRSTLKALSLHGDVVFATSTPLTIAIPALVASTLQRVPFVFEVRDMWPDVPIAIGAIRHPMAIWMARKLELLAYHRAAKVVALAPGMRDDIVAKGIDHAKVVVIPNGCDLDVFAGEQGSPSPREEFAWLGERKLVLFAGTLGMVNGVDYLVRVAAEIGQQDADVRFAVIGRGREWGRVRELAADLGVLDRTFFMFDSMPKRRLVPWLHAADVIVALFTGPRAVWKDAVQNKFFDALAAGKPIVNNFDGWQSRIAEESAVGAILPPDDIPAAATQLLRILHDETWLRDVPSRARILAEGRFSRENLAGELRKVLEDVVAAAAR